MSAQVQTAKSFFLVRYFSEVKDELGKVTWPNRQQTISKTLLVIGASVIVGIYIGVLDFVFTHLTTLIIK